MRIADRALEALRESTSSQVVVANDPAARDWFPRQRIVADEEAGFGPLAGIAAGLAAAAGQSVIVLAWDMPFVPAELLLRLRERASAVAGVDAVVPSHGDVAEPLCAWYAPSAERVCRALLERGERRASALAANLARIEWFREASLSDLGDVERMFTSVDTPERLDAMGGASP